MTQAPSLVPAALALVRSDRAWSALVPSTVGANGELFGVLRIEFPVALDNSGFVGWLASHLKEALGTGVFVICGHDSEAGGIYDYWGYPYEIEAEVLREIESLKRTNGDAADG